MHIKNILVRRWNCLTNFKCINKWSEYTILFLNIFMSIILVRLKTPRRVHMKKIQINRLAQRLVNYRVFFYLIPKRNYIINLLFYVHCGSIGTFKDLSWFYFEVLGLIFKD